MKIIHVQHFKMYGKPCTMNIRKEKKKKDFRYILIIEKKPVNLT